MRIGLIVATGFALALVIGCGLKKKQPAPTKPVRRGPKVTNISANKKVAPSGGKGSSARKLHQSTGKGGEIIYSDKKLGGRLYQSYVVRPQARAQFIALVKPLQDAVRYYYIEHDKYPEKLQDLNEAFTAVYNRIPDNLGLIYNSSNGKIDLVRFGPGK